MGNWVVGSVTFTALTGLPSASGWNTGKYWIEKPVVGDPIFERRQIALPGVNGLYIKKFGYRGRMISGSVFYVAASFDAAHSAVESDQDALSNLLFTCTLPWGTAYTFCQKEAFTPGEGFYNSDGKFGLKASITIFQTRT